jgi:hypothetical protein
MTTATMGRIKEIVNNYRCACERIERSLSNEQLDIDAVLNAMAELGAVNSSEHTRLLTAIRRATEPH